MILFTLLAGLTACTWQQNPGPVAMDRVNEPVRLVQRDVVGQTVWLEVAVRAGSAHDPVGKEGLAWLTANLLREGGAGARGPEQVEDALYRHGTDIEVLVDQEQVSFRTRCLGEDLGVIAPLLGEMLVEPQLDPGVFERLVGSSVAWLDHGVLGSDETLGLQVLDDWLFAGHPYGHPVRGRSGVLPTLSLNDVRVFLDDWYIKPSLVLGVAGDLAPAGTQRVDALRDQLGERPARLYRDVTPRSVPVPAGRELLVVEKPTGGTGVHFGLVHDLTRDDPDWPAVLLAVNALGEHRESHGRLYRALRGARGLNYGDYAYLEVFRQAGRSSQQEPGTARVQNPFLVWLRPTSAENGPFALRAALREVERFVSDGLAPDEFIATRNSLQQRVALWATDPGRRLGWAVESALMGLPDPIDTLPDALAGLLPEDVTAAVQRHIDPTRLRLVVVTADADAFLAPLGLTAPGHGGPNRGETLQGSETGGESSVSPIVYDAAPAAMSQDQLAEDAIIAAWPTHIDSVSVVSTEGIFR